VSRSREWRKLDNLAASRMFLEKHEALSASPESITLRFKLKRLGVDLDSQAAKDLLALVDSLGYQKMLRHQPIATRFSAVKRNTASKNVWV
jgi:hypothetical protein